MFEPRSVALKYGGFTTGGVNFDSKVRRESIDPVDLFHAHIGGMDAFARGLKIAAAQTMLLGKRPEDTDALRRLASDQLADPVVSQMFPDSTAEPVTAIEPSRAYTGAWSPNW